MRARLKYLDPLIFRLKALLRRLKILITLEHYFGGDNQNAGIYACKNCGSLVVNLAVGLASV